MLRTLGEGMVQTAQVGAAPPRRPSRLRPDASSVYSLPIANAPSRGAPQALVTIVEGFEFACVFCNKARPTMEALLKKYKGDLRIVYKHFIVHPKAREAAHSACAAAKQGKWHVMHERLWDQAFAESDFTRDRIEKIARRAKLKMGRFRSDRDGACVDLVKQDQSELAQVGATGTPSFFINGRFFSGARPQEQFEKLIDEEMEKAKVRIKASSSLSRANYYEREILNKGKTKLDAVP